MTILITGGNGSIGVALTERLLASGHEVVVYDIAGDEVPVAARFVRGNVADVLGLVAAAEGCDAGIHLAILSGDSRPTDILSVNVLGAYAFLQAARRAGFGNAIMPGSAPVHLPTSPQDNGGPGRTESLDHPYDLSKALQEMIARDFHAHGLPVMGLRFGHVVRGREGTNLEGTTSLAEEDYCRGGWVAVEDVAEACAAALQLTPDPEVFEVLDVIGARAARERFRVADAEARLGMRFAFDFAKYE